MFSVHRGTEIHSTDGGEPGGKRRGESLGGSVCHHGIGKGKLILLLSDGTGSGEDASRGSGRVMDLMEKMLEAGFGTEASVNLLNSALYAQNEEDDHPTIDLCSLDLYTGECEICKVGGVATFWKTSGRVLCVGGESLPLGIFQKVQIERQMCQIRPEICWS